MTRYGGMLCQHIQGHRWIQVQLGAAELLLEGFGPCGQRRRRRLKLTSMNRLIDVFLTQRYATRRTLKSREAVDNKVTNHQTKPQGQKQVDHRPYFKSNVIVGYTNLIQYHIAKQNQS